MYYWSTILGTRKGRWWIRTGVQPASSSFGWFKKSHSHSPPRDEEQSMELSIANQTPIEWNRDQNPISTFSQYSPDRFCWFNYSHFIQQEAAEEREFLLELRYFCIDDDGDPSQIGSARRLQRTVIAQEHSKISFYIINTTSISLWVMVTPTSSR